MAITRWDPFQELDNFGDRLNRLFSRSGLARELGREGLTTDWAPSVDISETAEEFLVKAELPGVRKEDIKIAVEHGVLRISGERKEEKEENNKRFHRVERFHGSFLRSFGVPDNVDQTKLAAEMKDGLLTVHLPKTMPARPSAVEVKVA